MILESLKMRIEIMVQLVVSSLVGADYDSKSYLCISGDQIIKRENKLFSDVSVFLCGPCLNCK